jgi:hypothetical protein
LVGIHGSYADGTAIDGLSDLDLVVVVPDEYLKTWQLRLALGRAIGRLNAICRSIDSYQHHGVFTIHESTFGAFPECYLPVVVLQDVMWITGVPQTLEVLPMRSRLVSALNAMRLLRYLHWNGTRLSEASYFKLREVLQVVQLVPCLVGEVLLSPMRKEVAIPWLLDRECAALEVLELCGHQRRHWADYSIARDGTKLPEREVKASIIAGFGGIGRLQELIEAYVRFLRTLMLDSFGGLHG